jgi:hypothetical protein
MNYRAGDWVQVLNVEEITKTLGDDGAIGRMPFMPEMLQYCGKRFQVSASAHKTCDTIYGFKGRRLEQTVHLSGLRCEGSSHGGCQAACLLFWKTDWLKPVAGPERSDTTLVSRWPTLEPIPESIERATRLPEYETVSGSIRYSCQATRVVDATQPQAWYELGQYWKDLTSRNFGFWAIVKFTLLAGYNVVMRSHWRGHPYPSVKGLAEATTPTEVLNLREGELVEVKSKEEIMLTLNKKQRNRGMWFDVEQLPHCGKRYRVLRRVEKIINEQTGEIVQLANPCIILDGVACSGCYSRDRMFCPRSIYSYWREIWLKRVP